MNSSAVGYTQAIQASQGSPYANITVIVDRSLLREAPGAATYTLEVYNLSACPPEPSTRISDFGSATDSGAAGSGTEFVFRPVMAEQELQALAGKMLVQRAIDPASEPIAAVACTAALQYQPGSPDTCGNSG